MYIHFTTASILSLTLFGCASNIAAQPAPSPTPKTIQTTAATKDVVHNTIEGFGCLSPDLKTLVLWGTRTWVALSLTTGKELWKEPRTSAPIGCFRDGFAYIGANDGTVQVAHYTTGKTKRLQPSQPVSKTCGGAVYAQPWSSKGEVGVLYNLARPYAHGGRAPSPEEEEQRRQRMCCATGRLTQHGDTLHTEVLDEQHGPMASCAQYTLAPQPKTRRTTRRARVHVSGHGSADTMPSTVVRLSKQRELVLTPASFGCTWEVIASMRVSQKRVWKTPTQVQFGECPRPSVRPRP